MIGMDDGSIIEGDTIEGDTYNEYNEIIDSDNQNNDDSLSNSVFDFLNDTPSDEDPFVERNPIWDDILY